MLDETFAEAIAHKPAPWRRGSSGHVVLGQRLRPFSFWHAANLDFIESPFAGHAGKQIDFTSLYLAAKCCQLKYPLTIATRGGIMQRLSAQFTTLRFARRFVKNALFRHQQLNAFSSYLADYMTCGPIFTEREGGKPVRIPWYLYYVAMLVKHAGYTKTEAWNSTVAESQWWVAALMISGGNDVDIMSATDRAQLRAIGYDI